MWFKIAVGCSTKFEDTVQQTPIVFHIIVPQCDKSDQVLINLQKIKKVNGVH